MIDNKKLNECNLINPLSSYDSAKKSFINTVHGANLERAKRKEVNHIEIDLKDLKKYIDDEIVNKFKDLKAQVPSLNDKNSKNRTILEEMNKKYNDFLNYINKDLKKYDQQLEENNQDLYINIESCEKTIIKYYNNIILENKLDESKINFTKQEELLKKLKSNISQNVEMDKINEIFEKYDELIESNIKIITDELSALDSSKTTINKNIILEQKKIKESKEKIKKNIFNIFDANYNKISIQHGF